MSTLLSVIVPVYFNQDTLHDLHRQIKCAFENHISANEFEIIFVDDGSLDESFEILSHLAKEDPTRVRVIRLSRNFGSHSAILAGLKNCQGRFASIIGADLQESPEIVIKMLNRALKENSEVVLACREQREESWGKIVFANLYYFLMRVVSQTTFPHGGFDSYLIERKVIDAIVSLNESNTSLTALILWMGFRRSQIEYTKKARQSGKSRWTLRKKVKLLLDSLISFSHAPIQIMHILGFFTAFSGFTYAIFIIFLRIFNGRQVEGWASLMVAILFFSGTTLVCLGIVGEYLWRTLDAARSRPPFIIAEKINFKATPSIQDKHVAS